MLSSNSTTSPSPPIFVVLLFCALMHSNLKYENHLLIVFLDKCFSLYPS